MMKAGISLLKLWTRRVLEGVDRLVYPRVCPACGVSLHPDEKAGRPAVTLCEPCRSTLTPVQSPYCARCGESFSSQDRTLTCFNCEGRRLHFDFAYAPFSAEGILPGLIHRLKYRKEQYLAPLLAELAAEGLRESRLRGLSTENAFFTPVPLHASRRREREFNQSEEISLALTRATGIPTIRCLRRIRATQTQTRLGRAQRLRNIGRSITWHPRTKAEPLVDRTAVLIDDVFTTGATADSCAARLKEAGVKRVVVLTVARG